VAFSFLTARIIASGEHALMCERDYLDMLCNTEDGVYIVDANKRIIRWNKGAENILGYSEADVINHDCYQLISGKIGPDKAHCSPNCPIHSNGLKGTPQINFDLLTQASSREPLWLNVAVLSPVNSSEPFVVHIVRDITCEKKTALALDQFVSNLGSFRPASCAIATERLMSQNPAGFAPTQDKVVAGLSAREIEVLKLLAEGLSTKGLAQKLNISPFTARNHMQNILVKLNLHSKAQAVAYAFKKGIL
jgi:PAS domain S-box-containing protein